MAAAPEIESHEWLEVHPADLPRLVVTDPEKLHVVAAATYEPLSWQWRLHVPEQANLRLFIASEGIPAQGFPAKCRASDLPGGEIPLRAEIRQGRHSRWKLRAVYPSGLSGQEIPEDHCTWVVEPDGYAEVQAGTDGTELASPGEPIVLLRLRARQTVDGHESCSCPFCDENGRNPPNQDHFILCSPPGPPAN